MTEKQVQSCPRRIHEIGPWEHKPDLDAWETNRWTTDAVADKKRIEKYEKENPGGSAGTQLWLYTSDVPRTCSFCGSVHPEDAIALVREGWVIDPSTKKYKAYLEPPGYNEHMREVISKIRKMQDEKIPRRWSPTPPVKVYFMHFTQEQVDAFFIAGG